MQWSRRTGEQDLQMLHVLAPGDARREMGQCHYRVGDRPAISPGQMFGDREGSVVPLGPGSEMLRGRVAVLAEDVTSHLPRFIDHAVTTTGPLPSLRRSLSMKSRSLLLIPSPPGGSSAAGPSSSRRSHWSRGTDAG